MERNDPPHSGKDLSVKTGQIHEPIGIPDWIAHRRGIAYWESNEDHRLGFRVSAEFFRMLGYEQESFPFSLEQLVELAHPQHRDWLQSHLDLLLTDQKEFLGEVQLRRSDGGWQRVEICAYTDEPVNSWPDT